MLSPLGSLVIKFDNHNIISGAESSLEFEDEDNVWDATLHAPSPSICKNEEELDLEDLISTPDTEGLEEPTPSDLSVYLIIEVKDGTKKRVHKAHALKVLFQEIVVGGIIICHMICLWSPVSRPKCIIKIVLNLAFLPLSKALK